MPEPRLSDWLALREAVDHAARSEALTRVIAEALPSVRPLRILDLGTGAGSNIRFLTPRLPTPQAWTAADRDTSLMARLPAGVEGRRLELGSLDGNALFEGVHLVTASALIDLVSASWIDRLARICAGEGAAALFALNYNGWSACVPLDSDDEFVLEQFNRHQRSNDKGFGRAVGPDATEMAAKSFTECDYEVRIEPSDWSLTPEMDALQTALIEGWAHAASEIVPGETQRIAAWLARRLEHVRLGRSHITVGHTDLAAWRVRSPA
jgi:hypothetical protein